jgi:hypothetical protein
MRKNVSLVRFPFSFFSAAACCCLEDIFSFLTDLFFLFLLASFKRLELEKLLLLFLLLLLLEVLFDDADTGNDKDFLF